MFQIISQTFPPSRTQSPLPIISPHITGSPCAFCRKRRAKAPAPIPQERKPSPKRGQRSHIMADLLCRLYENDIDPQPEISRLRAHGIEIKRAHPVNKTAILDFIEQEFSSGWRNEAEHCFSHCFTTMYIAVKEKKVIGFACYEATGRDFFGPVGVKSEYRRMHIGLALSKCCLNSMKEMGYAYAVIGWAAHGAFDFYKQHLGAVEIPDSEARNSIYRNLLQVD